MRMEWTRNQFFTLLITIVVVVGISFIMYQFFYLPEKKEVTQLEETVATESQLLQVLEQEQSEEEEVISLATSREVQSKLPVLKAPDQMLLALERAESVSNSFIESIAVNSSAVLTPEEEPSSLDVDSDIGEDEGPVTDVDPEVEQTEAPLPVGVSSMTFDLSVASQNFTDLMSFLSEVMDSSRIVSIESVSFNDDRIIEGELTYFFYFVTLSAYYYPGLDELEDELPEYHYNTESNKQNPFPYGDGETNLNEAEQSEN
ncbi:hypothetical protein H0266_00890 [Halobacillus locisalis]|uniref:Type IV pilus assembly protein PilO n=1 Tax=Halobacillus locisalis TaxID=220753 RepID=A0A838CMX3_9BACI|nr:hypothetical protein [Halobacillus locisalis]MBA2173447.1 hypothetical protein [Halobacillus locisalis]